MTDIIIKSTGRLLTMDDAARELCGTDIRISGGVVAEIGTGLSGPHQIDASGCLVTPGLVNTHHHLYQSLTRAVPQRKRVRVGVPVEKDQC